MAARFRLHCAVAAFLACTSTAASARAYSTPDAYAERPSAGGGGGRWFSGSPADGFGCSVCHTAAPEQRRFPLYVAGLPSDGYVLAARQEVVLSWPEFAARWRELRPNPGMPPPPESPSPSVGLVVELVAESGKGSGTIEIQAGAAGAGELCETTRPNLQPRLGVKLYQVRAGLPSLQVKPDSMGVLRCESRQLGQRCIVALTSCGAQQVRFVWTAPPTWEGPIWFSAGFVASEALSGTPEQDWVEEISVPLTQAGTAGGEYEETLRGGCAVASAGGSGGSGGAFVFVFAVLVITRKRGQVSVRCASGVVLLLIAGGGCVLERADAEPQAYPSAGLYTPGSTLGASDPTDVPMEGAGLGNRCVALPAIDASAVPTTGTLTLEYSTQTLAGRYAPKNCTAAWIETPDGRYVATIEIGAGLRRPGLVYFQDHACTEKPGPDVVTSATLPDHVRPHEAKWRGRDFEGKPVADGAYKLFIEVTESDKEPGDFAVFDFSKGPAPFSVEAQVAFDGPLAQVTLTWEVEAAAEGNLGGTAGAN